MFIPYGYLNFRQAARLLPDMDDDLGSDDPKGDRLGAALASGDLVAEGVVIAADGWNGDVPEQGQLRALRPETWRAPMARDAVLGPEPTGQLHQEGFVLTPIIARKALDAWLKQEAERISEPTTERNSQSDATPGLSYGAHAIPADYIAFDRISSLARVWAEAGKIDADTLDLLNPPDTDAMTQALASGNLRAFGISKRNGAIIALPPSTWRMEVAGAPQSIWAIGGNDILAGPEGDLCLPVLTLADLARALGLSDIPPDPIELPEGWKAAEPIKRPAAQINFSDRIEAWMQGYAEGFKANGKTVKREDAISAATRSCGCTYRLAETAFEALPYPALRHPPRTQAP